MNHEGSSKTRDSGGVIPASFTIILMALVFVGITSFTVGRIGANALEHDPAWRALFDGFADVGIGVLTASSVLLIIEMTTIDRIVRKTKEEVEDVVSSHHATLHQALEIRLREDSNKLQDVLNQRLSGIQLREMGIVDHFAERKDAVPYVMDAIESARRVRMLGVSHSLFWEAADYDDEAGHENPEENGLEPRLVGVLQKDENARLDLIYLSRARLDLYEARDNAERGGNGEDLLLDARYSLNRFALPIYFRFAAESWGLIQQGNPLDPYEKMEKRLRQFRIYESWLPPTVSLIIADEKMFVSPYLADSNCFSEPCTVYQRKTKSSSVADDWDACWRHYEKTIDESSRLISDALIQEMAKDMDAVIALYDQMVGDDLPEKSDLRFDREGPSECFVRALYEKFDLAKGYPDDADLGIAAPAF